MATLLLAKTAALELGADENFVQAAIDRALLALQHELHGLPLTFGVRAKELQKQLTDLVHNQKLSDLRAHASHHDATRLASLSSPHALAWTTGPSPWFRLSPTDFRAGIRVVLGIPWVIQGTPAGIAWLQQMPEASTQCVVPKVEHTPAVITVSSTPSVTSHNTVDFLP